MQTANGDQSVCDFTVAVNRRGKKNQNGQDEADFFRVTVWNQQAENAAKYLAKGKKVAVVGEVSCRCYQGNDGVYRASLEVKGMDVEYLSPAGTGNGAQTGGGYDAPASTAPAPASPPPPHQMGFTEVDIPEDDLPF